MTRVQESVLNAGEAEEKKGRNTEKNTDGLCPGGYDGKGTVTICLT